MVLRNTNTLSIVTNRLFCRRNANAEGCVIPGGFIVFKGSVIATSETKSCPTYTRKLRKKLKIKDGILQEDTIFKNASAASSTVCGASSNGNYEWTTNDGIRLGELEEYHEN